MVESPVVSVIVPCRNERDHIEACVSSILRQEALNVEFEIVVADGMSDDGTREILQRLANEHPSLRLVDNAARIPSTGLNAAIRAARGRIIIRMDAHTEYAPDYVRQCIGVLEETGADNVGGPWVAQGDRYLSRAIAAAFQSPFAVGGARGHAVEYHGEVDTVYLGCWRREVFDRIGLFDEQLVRNQDDEFNLRLTRAGGKVWQSPRIRSWYKPRSSLAALFKQYLQYGYWKVRVIQKHKLPASFRHLVPGSFLFSLVLLLLVSLWWPLAISLWMALMGGYFLASAVASFASSVRTGWRFFPLLPIVFACFHFGYAYGFLRGILDFVILRSGPRHSLTKITRTPRKESAD
jgi:succinoglycan biosynthesis protein ExoA